MATRNQGFELTACIRVSIWIVAFTVFDYVLSRLTDSFAKKKSVIFKTFSTVLPGMEKKPRDKQPHYQGPLVIAPGEKPTERTLGTTWWDIAILNEWLKVFISLRLQTKLLYADTLKDQQQACQRSFSYRAVQLWNDLPESLANIESFNVFKNAIKGRALDEFLSHWHSIGVIMHILYFK